MLALVPEKDQFIIRFVTAFDEIDTFFCTNGLKTVINAEDPFIESYLCTTPGKGT